MRHPSNNLLFNLLCRPIGVLRVNRIPNELSSEFPHLGNDHQPFRGRLAPQNLGCPIVENFISKSEFLHDNTPYLHHGKIIVADRFCSSERPCICYSSPTRQASCQPETIRDLALAGLEKSRRTEMQRSHPKAILANAPARVEVHGDIYRRPSQPANRLPFHTERERRLPLECRQVVIARCDHERVKRAVTPR